MLNQRRYGWVGLALILILTACGTDEGTGTIGAGTVAADDTEQADTTDTSSGTSEAGTQTDDDTGTSEAGTQTDDDTGTSEAGTQTDDATSDDDTGTSDGDTQTDDATSDDDTGTSDGDTQTDDDTGNTDVDPDTDTETDTGDGDTTGYDLNGKWEGSYTCSQGFTRVTLQIVHESETNTLDTVFAFFADDSNPDVPTGRFTMDGSYTPDTQAVELLEDAWIEQPGGYVMISLSGTLDPEANVISGTVLESGCSTFSVARGG